MAVVVFGIRKLKFVDDMQKYCHVDELESLNLIKIKLWAPLRSKSHKIQSQVEFTQNDVNPTANDDYEFTDIVWTG